VSEGTVSKDNLLVSASNACEGGGADATAIGRLFHRMNALKKASSEQTNTDREKRDRETTTVISRRLT
jgi:hypothetical protein